MPSSERASDPRPPRRRSGTKTGPTLLAAVLGLAVLGAGALVFTDDARWLRLGVVAALWAALVGAFAAARYRREVAADRDRSEELRRVYELELEREVSARREYELEVETHTRRRVEEETRGELDGLRTELRTLRQNLEALLGGEVLVERIALRAESTRLRSLSDHSRAAERALPQGGSRTSQQWSSDAARAFGEVQDAEVVSTRVEPATRPGGWPQPAAAGQPHAPAQERSRPLPGQPHPTYPSRAQPQPEPTSPRSQPEPFRPYQSESASPRPHQAQPGVSRPQPGRAPAHPVTARVVPVDATDVMPRYVGSARPVEPTRAELTSPVELTGPARLERRPGPPPAAAQPPMPVSVPPAPPGASPAVASAGNGTGRRRRAEDSEPAYTGRRRRADDGADSGRTVGELLSAYDDQREPTRRHRRKDQ